jgi:hypothetical protein
MLGPDNQLVVVMEPEFPRIDQDVITSPHAQEVEYALILSRMINTAKEDPSQLRLAIYEFARARLEADTAWLEGPERNRLLGALETAIQGVEKFSAHRGESERLRPPPVAQIGLGASPARQPSTSLVEIYEPNSVPDTVPVRGIDSRPGPSPVANVRTQVRRSALAIFSFVLLAFGLLVFGTVAGLLIYAQRLTVLRAGLDLPASTVLQGEKSISAPSEAASRHTPVAADVKTTAALSNPLPFALPSDYGVYAVTNDTLSELHLLSEQVPDKRVAMSTPVSEPSRTTLPNGKAKFVMFRRDLVGNAPDRIDVRVVARVVRALGFDAKGKPNFLPVSDAWNIRNYSYEFRVRPIAGNPEMLLVQASDPDFTLPAGRYALALKTQGYDFTVAGNITEPWQCLERTDAANGMFYSDCQNK